MAMQHRFQDLHSLHDLALFVIRNGDRLDWQKDAAARRARSRSATNNLRPDS
jgi:hypothetical protein